MNDTLNYQMMYLFLFLFFLYFGTFIPPYWNMQKICNAHLSKYALQLQGMNSLPFKSYLNKLLLRDEWNSVSNKISDFKVF